MFFFFMQGVTWLMCKGADTNVLERVVTGDVETIERHINEFAKVRYI